jgi:hypothetical protein
MQDRKISSVFFDTRHVRQNGNMRRNKNHAPVMPEKPMYFLGNYEKMIFSDRPVKSDSHPAIIFVSLRQIPKNQPSCKK